MTRDDNMEFLKTQLEDLKGVCMYLDDSTLLIETGLDSLDIVEIQINYEEKFNVIIEDGNKPLTTVGDLLDLLQ